MAAVIKRSIVYAVEGGTVVVRDLNAIGTAAQSVGTSAQQGAANANRALRSIGDEAKGMSGASRSAVLNVSNQLQDFIVQVQGGTSAWKAFGQQAPQALDAVAMAAGGLSPMFGLVTAGLATVAALAPAFITLVRGIDAATQAAASHKAATEALNDSISHQIGNVEDDAQAYRLLTSARQADERVMLESNLRQVTKDLADQRTKVLDLTAAFREEVEAAANLVRSNQNVGGADPAVVEQMKALQAASDAIGKFKLDPGEGYQTLLVSLREITEQFPRSADAINPLIDKIRASSKDGRDMGDEIKTLTYQLAELGRAMAGLPAQKPPADIVPIKTRVSDAKKGATSTTRAENMADTDLQRAADQDAKVLEQLRVAVEKNADPIAAAMEAAQARLSDFASPQTIAKVRELAAAVAEDAEFRKADAEAAAAMAEEQAAATAALSKANPVQEETNRLLSQYQNWLQDGVITQEQYNRLVEERTAKEAVLERQREQSRRRQAIEDALAGGSPLGGVKAGLLQIQDQAEDSGQAIAQSMTGAFDQVTGSMVDMLNGGEDAFSGLKTAALDFVKTIEQVIIKMLIVQAVEAAMGFGGGGGGAAASQAPTLTTIGGVYHGGGVTGEGGGGSRSLPAWLFATAPRAHGGMMLGPDEVPIVAKRGERVLSPEETRAYGSRGAVTITHAPTYNISGIADVRMLQAVVEASSAKANADLERRWRSDPMSRRATVGH